MSLNLFYSAMNLNSDVAKFELSCLENNDIIIGLLIDNKITNNNNLT